MTRVLVVDDEDDIRLLERMLLERAGLDVIEASSGDGALAALEANDIDVLLLDIRMPPPDGWAVLDELRARGWLARMNVIVVSAHTDAEAAERARAAGCGQYLSKPFGPDALVAAVCGPSREEAGT